MICVTIQQTFLDTLALPIYVTAASTAKEQARIDEVLKHAKKAKFTRHRPKTDVHSASTLRKDRNAKGAAAN